MDKELIADDDLHENESIIDKNVASSVARSVGTRDAILNRNFASLAGEVAKMNKVVAGSVIGDFAKQHRALASTLNPLAGELERIRRIQANSIIGDFAKQHRALASTLNPLTGELDRMRQMQIRSVSNDFAGLNRALTSGIASPLAGELAKVNRVLAGSVINDFAKQHRALTFRMATPLADEMARMNRVLAGTIATDFAKRHRALALGLSPFAGELAKMKRALGQSVSPIARVFSAMNLGSVLEKNGWFPHYTMPEDLIAENQGNPAFNEVLIDYYRRNWPTVRQSIERRLGTYLVDNEAKEAFRECLDAHENGLYRLVCRSSFPEVERIIRIEINHNNVGQFSVQNLVRQHFDDLPVSVFPNSKFGFAGYRQFTEHLYAPVKDDADRQRFSSHPIPNRHAAIHGLIPYSSEQSSLNSIFIAEYVFQLITAQKSFEHVIINQSKGNIPAMIVLPGV